MKIIKDENYEDNLERDSLGLKKILKSGIPDIALVYGGVRGRTMSSRHQGFAWPIIKEGGILTIIDLRENGIYNKLSKLCEEYGMAYFHYPVDKTGRNITTMVKRFPELCRIIDSGGFYISCAQGLHRTDWALCLYWVFYAADKGISPPELRGCRYGKAHINTSIMRILNCYFNYIEKETGIPPISKDKFKIRKGIIEELSKKMFK